MTTQNHHEHRDVDENAAGHPFVPETTSDASAPETATPVETEAEADLSSSASAESTASTEAPVQEQEASVLPVEEAPVIPAQDQQSQDLQAEDGSAASPEATPVASEEQAEPLAVQSAPEVAPESIETLDVTVATDFSYDTIPLVSPEEEEVRPFTAFMEEFRQAQERLNASLQESQLEAFASLSPADEGFVQAESVPVSNEDVSAAASVAAVIEAVDSHTDQKSDSADEAISSLLATAASNETTESSATAQAEEAAKVEPSSAEKDVADAGKAATPPVSPLLRPASRIRMPRQGRHHREELTSETLDAVQAVQPPTTPTETSEPAAQAAEPTPPRPARRYRFDRPAVSNGTTQAATVTPPPSPRPEEIKESGRTTPAVATGEQANEAAAKAAPTPAETPAAKESVTAESAAATPAPETGRRRHGHERHKEAPAAAAQAAPAPAPVAAPPALSVVDVAAPTVPPEEVAPEDLPPLEYSELQKATSRRRRRHRAGSAAASVNNNVAAPASEEAVPTPTPVVATPPAFAPVPATPTAPAARAASASQAYTIVSGYTVNQMNQGNDIAGPFMGPEPSPARGSVFTRDGRTVRAETQRTPAPFPARTHEASHTTTSISHFTNAVVQALQTQTDRMVAEMRRAGQAPTNVSVSLPPFPSTERVGVFVDVANLLYSARTLRISVDFGKLLDFLRGNRRLVRAHAYCPTSPQAGDEQMFLQAVKGLGYRITTKNYKTFSSGAKKADLDLDLCMDVVRLVDGRAVDCIVLVSGDSDFMPMLDYCSDHGVRVEVAAFDEAMSATLRQSCDLFVNLSMLEEIRS